MKMGDRQENFREAPETSSWNTQCHAAVETRDKVEGAP